MGGSRLGKHRLPVKNEEDELEGNLLSHAKRTRRDGARQAGGQKRCESRRIFMIN